MARAKSTPSKRSKTLPRKDKKESARSLKQAQSIAAAVSAATRGDDLKRSLRKDQLLAQPLKDRLKNIVDEITPDLADWIRDGAQEESKLKAAKITIDLMEYVQPKLTRVVLSEEESKALARGVGAELRKQIAQQLLQNTPTSDEQQ